MTIKPHTEGIPPPAAAGDAGDNAGDNAAEKSGGRARKAASAFRTISEVADDLGVQQHVLRFWETKFTQVKPLKRGGGRRYYRPEDVILLKKIHHLLYTEGYTIKGVQKLLKGQGKQQIVAGEINNGQTGKGQIGNGGINNGEIDSIVDNGLTAATKMPGDPAPGNGRDAAAIRPTLHGRDGTRLSDRQRVILESMLGELKDLRSMIRGQ